MASSITINLDKRSPSGKPTVTTNQGYLKMLNQDDWALELYVIENNVEYKLGSLLLGLKKKVIGTNLERER